MNCWSRFLLFPFLMSLFMWTQGQQPEVFVFMATTCPICQQYTGGLKSLEEGWGEKVKLNLVFGRKERRRELRAFAERYRLEMRLKRDRRGKLAKRLGPTHTPEAFLVAEDGKLMYRGKIDNLYEDLGVRRGVVTEHYLKDAVESVLTGEPVTVSRTQAVGCLIE